MNPKVQYIFDKYVEAVNKLGRDFDYDKMIPYLDKALVKAGLDLTPSRFVREVWHQLENDDTWNPHPVKVNAYLNSLPPRTLKRKLTDKIVTSRLNQHHWSDYRDLEWVKNQKAVAFLIDNDLHDKKPVTITKKRKGKAFSVAVFLGDLRAEVGITELPKGHTYAHTYDAVDAELGKAPATKLLKDIYADVDLEVTNWPNVTNLDDVEYEIVFYPDDEWAESLMEETAEEVAAVLQSMLS